MNRLTLLLTLLTTSFVLTAATLPPGFSARRVAGGLDPTRIAEAPDGRIFVLEKSGRVLIIRDGQLLPDPFVEIDVDNYNERGLGGIAFHPDFETNHYLYLYYSVPGGNHNRLIRLRANGDYAVPESEEVLLDIDATEGTVHNGGAMVFGADGKLYLAVGDGKDGPAAQRQDRLLGKVLRLNDDGSIPADNPFYQHAQGKYRSIYALGLRNPFTLDVDPLTGDILINDVGEQEWEEINRLQAGANYGWPITEGRRQGEAVPDNYSDPLHYYPHGEACAVVGAAYYRSAGAAFPEEYEGRYFFADYCDGSIYYLNPQRPETGAQVFATEINRPMGLLTARDGSLYYLARAGFGGGSESDNTATRNGSLWQIRYTGNNQPQVAIDPRDLLVSAGDTASFRVVANGAPPLSYQWFRDGQPLPGATAELLWIENCMLTDSNAVLFCRVSNAYGEVRSAEARLWVTANRRPEPEILFPAPGSVYRAGDTLRFAGRAGDPETGELPSDRLQWQIDFHHNEHTHPGMDAVSGLSEGEFVIPVVGEIDNDVWYRIILTATDEAGLSRRVTRDVQPAMTTFRVETEPAGLPLNIDGKIYATPVEINSVRGLLRTLKAPQQQLNGSRRYEFAGWEPAESARLFVFRAGSHEVIRAIYHPLEPQLKEEDFSLHFYPNPANGPVNAELQLAVAGYYRWTLVAPNGQVLRQQYGLYERGVHWLPLKAENLPEGLYICNLYNADGELIHSGSILIQ